MKILNFGYLTCPRKHKIGKFSLKNQENATSFSEMAVRLCKNAEFSKLSIKNLNEQFSEEYLGAQFKLIYSLRANSEKR